MARSGVVNKKGVKEEMTYKNKLFGSVGTVKAAASSASEDMLGDLMSNPEYLRHSSSVINEALKEGFDVLQLPNGDIVTTGTKVITNTYVWDKNRAKLVKARGRSEKPRGRKAKAKAKEAAE